MFAVGDDDQSIYAFRGANVGNMADFERDFHVENVIRLEQNYRSHGNILDAANALISQQPQAPGQEPLDRRRAGRAGAHLRGADRRLRGALARRGGAGAHARRLARREMAVLYRSNAQSRVLEHALFSQGIPYRVYGGLRFFERMEIKHALAYLRLHREPGRRRRVPARGELSRARHRRALDRSAAGCGERAGVAACGTRRRTLVGQGRRDARRVRAA